MKTLKDTDFQSLIASETNGRMRVRLLALSHIKDGKTRTETAKFLKVSRRSVNDWTARFLKDGLQGLKEKSRCGRPKQLSVKQLQLFKKYVLENNIKPRGGRLMASDMREYVRREFEVEYSLTNIYRLLHSLNFSWITSRSRHPKQSQEAQDEFKKTGIYNDPDDPWPYQAFSGRFLVSGRSKVWSAEYNDKALGRKGN